MEQVIESFDNFNKQLNELRSLLQSCIEKSKSLGDTEMQKMHKELSSGVEILTELKNNAIIKNVEVKILAYKSFTDGLDEVDFD